MRDNDDNEALLPNTTEAKQDGELTGRELDAAVAERVMGWFDLKFLPQPNYFIGYAPAMNKDAQCAVPVPPYSSSIADAMEVENKIAELGLQTRYVLELAKIVDPRNSREDKVAALWWALVHSTAEQRCRAALAARENK